MDSLRLALYFIQVAHKVNESLEKHTQSGRIGAIFVEHHPAHISIASNPFQILTLSFFNMFQGNKTYHIPIESAASILKITLEKTTSTLNFM